MKNQLLKILVILVSILLYTTSYSQPNWTFPVTGTNHTILLQSTNPMTIDGVQIESGDYIGVFYDSLGILACGGFVEWTGVTTTITAWGVDVGNDGFLVGEVFNWKIWDASSNLEMDAISSFLTTGFPNGNSFAVNGMSGVASLTANSPIVQTGPDWNYAVTGTNHTILVPNTIPITIDGVQIDVGDFIGVFFDSLGTLKCGGYVEWTGQTNSVSAWGADIGYDGFAAGEEFTWKIWDASAEVEFLATATYGTAFPNTQYFSVNGISGLESLISTTLSTPNWNYQITGTNHTILVQNIIPILINGVQIETGDYIGVFYNANGGLACGGYTEWNGQTTNITAWGVDVGNDGFLAGEEFKWKIFDASENVEYLAEASYIIGGPFPNTGSFFVNGLSGLSSLTAPFSVATDPGWSYAITSANHSILLPQTISIMIDDSPFESGDYIGAFFDSLGTLVCAGYTMWEGNQTALSVWGADAGNDGFAIGETFKWVIWDATNGNEYLAQQANYDPNFASDSTFVINGLSSLLSLNITSKAVTAIVAPVSACDLSTSEQIIVEITNYNIQPASEFLVSYFIGSGTIVSEMVYGSIPVGGSANYTFTQTADLSNVGNYNISAFTSLSNIYSETIEHYPLPTVSISGLASEYCENDATISLIGTPAGGIFSGPGVIQNTFSPNAAGTGIHTISYSYTNANGCSNVATESVTINELPIADFTADMACLGEASIFNYSAQGTSQVLSFDWDFGDGSFSVDENPTHIYTLPGTYNVTLTITNSFGCINSITKPAIVNNLPMAYFMGTNTCIGDTTFFSDFSFSTNANINTWVWDFGDGTGSFSQNPFHIYQQYGIYDVTLTVTNSNGCSHSTTNSISVFAEPTAIFIADTVCLGNATQFTDMSSAVSSGGTGNITTWFWDFGDGGISNIANPIHTFTTAGTHFVSLTVTNSNGCSASISLDVLVYDLPLADFSAPTVCLGVATMFTDQSVPANGSLVYWSWNFGFGNLSNIQNPTFTYPAAGTFSATLTVSDNACINSVTKTVEIYDLPVVDFSFTEVCFGNITDFTDLSIGSGSNIVSWNWNFGGGFSSSDQNPSFQFSDYGSFPVSLTVTNQNTCENSLSQDVTVNALPNVTFAASTECLGDPTTITYIAQTNPPSTVDTWLWDFGDGSASNLTNPQHTYANFGTFVITLTVTNQSGCSFSVMNIAEVLALPQVDIGDDVTIGNNQSVTIDAGSTFNSYLWNTGETSQSIDVNTTGFYNVAVIGFNGCSNVSNDKYVYVAPWVQPNTGTNHTILIQNTIPITIDTNNIENGDLIGVFYDSLGTLACGGFLQWTGITTAITVWGADVGNDGFAPNEEFNWKIFDVSEDAEYDAVAVYNTIDFVNTNTFVVNGLSGIIELSATTSQIQDINLVAGWRIFSTYIEPFDPNISVVFSTISSDVEIIKNGLGMMYWPAYGINLIGNMVLGEGYQIKMNNPQILSIEGMAAIPEQDLVNIPSGWSIMGYLRQTASPIPNMLSSFVNDISIVKDGMGMMYWPAYNINLIGDMKPGEGYQIQLYNAVSFYFPPNSINTAKSDFIGTLPNKYKDIYNTGSNMSLCIPNFAWSGKTPLNGDEIGIFSESGKLVGSAVYNDNNLAIAIWGNDEYTSQTDGLIDNEKFIIKLWNGQNEISLQIESWIEGDEFFEKDKIAIVNKFSQSSINSNNSFELFQNSPNPFSETTSIGFSVADRTNIEISIFNILGEKLDIINFKNMEPGNYSFNYDASKLPSGTYFYKMKAGDFVKTKTFNLVK